MKIRTQFTLALSGIAAFSFLVAWLLSAWMASHVVSMLLTKMHEQGVQALASLAETALPRHEEPLLAQSMQSLLAVLPAVPYAYIEGADGNILMHTTAQFNGMPAASWKALPKPTKEYDRPVIVGNKPMAVVHLGVAADLRAAVFPTIRRALRPMLLAIVLIGIPFSVLLGLGLAVPLTRPIRRLAQCAAEVGQGDLSVEAPVLSANEMGDLAKQFNQMVQRLRTLDEVKDQLISSVSHDLRNPLAAITMMAEFLINQEKNEGGETPERQEILALIKSNATRLNIFVTNILDVAKIKAQRMEYHPQPIPVEAVFQNVQALFSIVAKQKNIRLQTDLPDQPLFLWADRDHFEQALTNLVSNALKFTGQGGQVVLGAREQKGKVEVYVQDTGRGISPEALPRLFNLYFQGDVTQQHSDGMTGTGLGLYIVKRTVEAMGGSVSVESQVNGGSRFTMILPLSVL